MSEREKMEHWAKLYRWNQEKRREQRQFDRENEEVFQMVRQNRQRYEAKKAMPVLDV